MTDVHQRPLPELDESNRFFWEAGRDGRLRILHCEPCGFWIHPPKPVCPRCLSRDVAPRPVAGSGRVYGYTINHQPWAPGPQVPYIIASVELDEQEGLRVATSLVGVDFDEVRIGRRVVVEFRQDEDVWLPFFRPAAP